jgi:hypothetical protein
MKKKESNQSQICPNLKKITYAYEERDYENEYFECALTGGECPYREHADKCPLPAYSSSDPVSKINKETLDIISGFFGGCMGCDMLTHHFYLEECSGCGSVDYHLKLKYLAAEHKRRLEKEKK